MSTQVDLSSCGMHILFWPYPGYGAWLSLFSPMLFSYPSQCIFILLCLFFVSACVKVSCVTVFCDCVMWFHSFYFPVQIPHLSMFFFFFWTQFTYLVLGLWICLNLPSMPVLFSFCKLWKCCYLTASWCSSYCLCGGSDKDEQMMLI